MGTDTFLPPLDLIVLDHDDDHDHVYTAMVQEFYDDLATYDVVAVCSAGNDAPYGRTLKDYYFSALSTDDNVGMPVGGINMDGTLYDFTPPDAGGAKKVVYAQATDLDLMLADGTMEWGADGGVSTPTQIVVSQFFISLVQPHQHTDIE